MNNLYNEIKNQIKEAMKSKDTLKRDALKMVIDKARAIEKEKNPNVVSEIIADDIIVEAIQRELKQLRQTLSSLPNIKAENVLNLRKETTLKINVLSAYLPTQMTEEEIKKYVEEELIELTSSNIEISPKIKGMVMKNIMPKLKGKADGKMINKVVCDLLNN